MQKKKYWFKIGGCPGGMIVRWTNGQTEKSKDVYKVSEKGYEFLGENDKLPHLILVLD